MPTAYAHAAAAPLLPNYVWRSYTGGRVLRQFRAGRMGGVGSNGGDDHFPEDWLASTVKARNGKNSQGPLEGISSLGHADAAGEPKLLTEALETEPAYWLGTKRGQGEPGRVLWKLLDSSVRLQIQAHPDAVFAKRRLNSDAGKTEYWYILGTRGDACVYLGFQRPPTRSDWGRMIREQKVEEMLACFEPIPVRAGDCFVVPAGTPHAIGAGVFMMELQEPTDWVVRCETITAGLALPPEACFMGLGLEDCLDVFDYRRMPVSTVREQFQQKPTTNFLGKNFCAEEIIGPAWRQFFRLNRLRGSGAAEWAGEELMLLLAMEGKGTLLSGEAEPLEVSAGQTWLLPGAANRWQWRADGQWEILLAKLPHR